MQGSLKVIRCYKEKLLQIFNVLGKGNVLLHVLLSLTIDAGGCWKV